MVNQVNTLALHQKTIQFKFQIGFFGHARMVYQFWLFEIYPASSHRIFHFKSQTFSQIGVWISINRQNRACIIFNQVANNRLEIEVFPLPPLPATAIEKLKLFSFF